MTGPKVIVSLDFARPDDALVLLDALTPDHCRVKVGKELFTRAGPALIDQIQRRGYEVFLDLKFHDIPTTVAAACKAAAELGVWMLNVHASGGAEMMARAREAIDNNPHKPLLIAVTVLTSLSAVDLEQIGMQANLEKQVMRLARLAHECRLDGIVCSPREVKMIAAELGPGFTLVTPGIRPAGSSNDDQRRVMTPSDALRAGSHYLVIGRPVTRADDPLAALKAIEDEINSVKREV